MNNQSDAIGESYREIARALETISRVSESEDSRGAMILALLYGRSPETMSEEEMGRLSEWFECNVSLVCSVWAGVMRGHIRVAMAEGEDEPSFSITDSGREHAKSLTGASKP